MALTKENFNFIREFVKRQAAIVLEDGKEYLVDMRLQPLADEDGLPDLDAFIAAFRKDPLLNERQERIVDAMTTNETLFFRDHHPWEALRDIIIPELIERNQATKQLRFWSAACSTGQEPYSLAMLILQNFPQLKDWDVKIIATDISQTVLDKAKKGCFTQAEVNRGLPATKLIHFFTQINGQWQINDEVRNMITFQKMNLLSTWACLPNCDFVFMRNVMIYFEVATKKQLLSNVSDLLHSHGYLILGGGETTHGIYDGFAPVIRGKLTAFQREMNNSQVPVSTPAPLAAASRA